MTVAILKQLWVVLGDTSSPSFLLPVIPSASPEHPYKVRGKHLVESQAPARSLTASMPRARGPSVAAGMCQAGALSQPAVGSARRVLEQRQVVLPDVAEQDACPPVNGADQGSQPLGAALALPELPVQAQRLQQKALQSARPQRGHRRRRETAVEEQKRQGGKGLSREG